MKPKLTSFKKLMGDQRIVLITPDNSSLDAHNPSESRKNGESCMGKHLQVKSCLPESRNDFFSRLLEARKALHSVTGVVW